MAQAPTILLAIFTAVMLTVPTACADDPKKAEQAELLEQAQRHDVAALRAMKSNKPAVAAEEYAKSLTLKNKAYPKADFPNGHIAVALTEYRLAGSLRDAGKPKDGLPHLERSLVTLGKLRPPTHPDLCYANELAGDLRADLGSAYPALDHYTTALAIARKAFADGTPSRHAVEVELLEKIAEQYFAMKLPKKGLALMEERHQYLTKMYPTAKYPDGHPDLALSYFALAGARNRAGQLKEAAEGADRCVDMLRRCHPVKDYPDGHPDVAGASMRAGELWAELREHQKALVHFSNGLIVSRKSMPDNQARDYLIGKFLWKMASQHSALGQTEGAEKRLLEAYDHYRKVYPPSKYPKGEHSLNLVQNLLATHYTATGQHDRAEQWVEESLRMARDLYPESEHPKGHPVLAIMLFNKGMMLLNRGDVDKSLKFFTDSLEMRRRVYSDPQDHEGVEQLIVSLNGLAGAYKQLGQLNRAKELYDEADEIRMKAWRGGGPTKAEIDTMFARANLAYAAGESLTGLSVEFMALGSLRQLYPKDKYPAGHRDLADAILRMARRLSMAGDAWNEKTEGYLEEAFQMYLRLEEPGGYPRGHPKIAELILAAGRYQMRRKNYQRALEEIEGAVKKMTKLYPATLYPDGHELLLDALSALGDVHLEMGHPDKALPVYEQALGMRQDLLAVVIRNVAEADALFILRELPESYGRVLASSAADPGAVARVYDAIWQSKGAGMRIAHNRHIAAHIASIRDPAIQKDWDSLQKLRRELSRVRVLAAGDPKAESGLRELTEKKENQERTLADALQKWSISLEDETYQVRPRDLARVLPPESVFVDVFVYDPPQRGAKPQYAVFVVAPGQPVRRVEVEASEVDDSVRAWRKAIPNQAPTHAPAVVRDKLWAKIGPLLPPGTRTLYVAPDGELTQVPWVAIPGAKEGEVLLDAFEGGIVNTPYGAFLYSQLMQKPRGVEAPKALAVGKVDYGRQTGDNVWPPLKGTTEELRQVLAVGGAKRAFITLTEREATTGNVLRALGEGNVTHAHIATHGIYDAQAIRREREQLAAIRRQETIKLGKEPLALPGAARRSPLAFSALVLAGANEADRDKTDAGYLTAEAIVSMPLENMLLCVLSACESGLGVRSDGEGVFGLQRALHIAGCRDVVGSLWSVDDQATTALMAKFYHELWVNGRPPAEALRAAQLTLYRHPELIPKLATGHRGKPDFDNAVQTATPPARGTAFRVSDTKLWAAFTLSGVGR